MPTRFIIYVGRKGGKGEQGEDGQIGSRIYTGTGAPDAGTGGTTDFYIDYDTGNVYEKSTGSWVLDGNLTQTTTFKTYEYTATLGQTDFTGVDENEGTALTIDDERFIIVNRSGRPLGKDDYSVNSAGDTVTLASGVNAGELIQIIVFNSVNLFNPDAGDVSFTPVGTIAATNVQAAIAELESEKLAASGGELTNYSEADDTPSVVAGAVSINATTCANIINLGQLAADTTVTFTDFPVVDKPITLKWKQGAAVKYEVYVTDGVVTSDTLANGVAGQLLETSEILFYGGDLVFPEAGSVTWKKGV